MGALKVWNKLGFWEYTCGCLQYQDGWDSCEEHKRLRIETKNRQCFAVDKFDLDWVDEEGDVNPADMPERRVAKQREVIQKTLEDEKNLPLPAMRKFETGAIRSNNDGKLDYMRFNHPLVEKVFAEYMHRHRLQEDGGMRSGDNWQKGWEKEISGESLLRHIKDIELHLKGYPNEATEGFIESICAARFNLNALLLQLLRENGRA